jgi:hypothetical protein
MSIMVERRSRTVDALTEDGSEGMSPEDIAYLPTQEVESLVDYDGAAEQAVLFGLLSGAEDSIVWPRHYSGPRTAAAMVAARLRLYERGAIVFDGCYWRLTERCGFVPPTRGYAACTRLKGHPGPCAHDLDKR